MNHYTDRDGQQLRVDLFGPTAQDLYADLVAAIEIGRALNAKCERLEAMLENAGDLAHNLEEERDNWTTAFLQLQHERDHLIYENARLRAEVDRLELVS